MALVLVSNCKVLQAEHLTCQIYFSSAEFVFPLLLVSRMYLGSGECRSQLQVGSRSLGLGAGTWWVTAEFLVLAVAVCGGFCPESRALQGC